MILSFHKSARRPTPPIDHFMIGRDACSQLQGCAVCTTYGQDITDFAPTIPPVASSHETPLDHNGARLPIATQAGKAGGGSGTSEEGRAAAARGGALVRKADAGIADRARCAQWIPVLGPVGARQFAGGQPGQGRSQVRQPVGQQCAVTVDRCRARLHGA